MRSLSDTNKSSKKEKPLDFGDKENQTDRHTVNSAQYVATKTIHPDQTFLSQTSGRLRWSLVIGILKPYVQRLAVSTV